ncbi:MAG: hypothetical protein IJQ84_00595 [Paludibacteraceae bacterium]|nr:hypothetical protein [Paludibacteraceae bacterium]
MRTYLKPATYCQPLMSDTFVCNITSVGGEQGEGQPQLAPKSTTVDF